jgi:hypothetical protein
VCPRTCVRFSAPLQSITVSLSRQTKWRIFNRLARSSVPPRCLANFLRISNFDTRVNLASHLHPAQQPHSFISLRGSKEPSGHQARAKPQANRLIRTAQNSKTSIRPFRPRSTQLLKITHPQRERLGLPSTAVTWVLIRSALNPRPPTTSNTWTALRSTVPPARSQSSLSQPSGAKPCCLVLTNLTRPKPSLQPCCNSAQSRKSVNRIDLAPALYLSASAALICDFLRIATPPKPRNQSL